MFYRIDDIPSGCSPDVKSILARRTLGALLAQYCGITVLPAIQVDDFGKPFFPSRRDIHFSLSHCESAVMAAVDYAPVGCDIEDIQSLPSAELLAVALSPEESRAVESSTAPGETFTALWTRKESAVKRSGKIPDDPRQWPSDDPLTQTGHAPRYAFSISVSSPRALKGEC